jgi:hypothetical protein
MVFAVKYSNYNRLILLLRSARFFINVEALQVISIPA